MEKLTIDWAFRLNRVGNAVRAWCQETHTSRRQVFVTTKIMAPAESQEKTLESLRESVNKINLDGKSCPPNSQLPTTAMSHDIGRKGLLIGSHWWL